MIQLTQKGKEIYPDTEILYEDFYMYYSICKVDSVNNYKLTPSDIKALLDMGLIEIK